MLKNKRPVRLTRIASLKKKVCDCDSGDQVVLQWSCMGRVQILHRGPADVYLSFQLEKQRTILSKVDVNISCSILKVS